MYEIHFRLYFWPFQIDKELFFSFLNFWKMAAGGHIGCPKITFDRISGHFKSIRNFFVDKMAADGHFGWDDNVNYRNRPR